MATLQEAEACPKCGEPGNKYAEKPSGNIGNKVLMYRCGNSACIWGQDPEDLGWIIEVDHRGQIPDRKAGVKQFPDLMGLIPAEKRAAFLEEMKSYAQPTDPKDLEPRSQ